MKTLPYTYSDGGRSAAGFRGEAGDCFVRAAAIASGLNYTDVYDLVTVEAAKERRSKKKRGRSSPRTGVYKSTAERVLLLLGFSKVSVMSVGTGCTTHMRRDEIPDKGKIVVVLSKHYAAVVDGVVMDTYDPSRDGDRCVYSYWVNGIDGVAVVDDGS